MGTQEVERYENIRRRKEERGKEGEAEGVKAKEREGRQECCKGRKKREERSVIYQHSILS